MNHTKQLYLRHQELYTFSIYNVLQEGVFDQVSFSLFTNMNHYWLSLESGSQSVYVVLISFGVNQCVIVQEDFSVKSSNVAL
jgi:hypothetical protein